MKRTLLIALAGLMLIAFTQCNKGTKEFRAAKEVLNSYKKDLKKAKTCNDLEKAESTFHEKSRKLEKLDEKNLKEDEIKKIKELLNEIEELEEEKDDKLCL